MWRMYRYSLLRTLRDRADMFWTMAFPVILATLFYITFGSSQMEQMKPIPAAVVAGENLIFESFIEELDGIALEVRKMEEEEALDALEDGSVTGIFFCSRRPSLTVAGVQIHESILEMLLDSYLQNQTLFEELAVSGPPGGALRAAGTMREQFDYIEPAGIGGSTQDSSLDSFFAVIAMACLYGALMGMEGASGLRADQSALAARRSTAPVRRVTAVVGEVIAAFTIQFLNTCILLGYLHFVLGIGIGRRWPLLLPVCALGSLCGVAFGIFIGTLRQKEGVKIGIIIAGTLTLCFLSGMMYNGMKELVERHVPVLNRVNPAALISDAFYSITVYEDAGRYLRSLLCLACVTAVLTAAGCVRLGRERYDSL